MAWDTDGDQLPDGREVTIGTNPHSDDSDQDGTKDRDEVRRNTASAPDSDRDGTPDWVELACDDTLDSDGDGIRDGDEHWFRTNPYSQHSDRDLDADYWEIAAGDNPRDPGGPGRLSHPCRRARTGRRAPRSSTPPTPKAAPRTRARTGRMRSSMPAAPTISPPAVATTSTASTASTATPLSPTTTWADQPAAAP